MWTFRAMNTDVTVAAPQLSPGAERALAGQVASLFETTERRFSRFRPDSELSRLNRERSTIVSPELLALLLRARAHARATAGLFEPAIAGALRAAGYDRSFAPGALDRDAPATAAPPARIELLEIDEARARVDRPPHVEVDLGGFLKGLTADRALALAPEIAVVDAGGDAALRGAPPGEAGWTVDIEDPRAPERVLGTLVVRDRAVATSATNRRRWRRDDQPMHHLIDPRTNTPARTDLIQVTVLAPTAEEADVLAKVVFLLGAHAGAAELERRGLAGVLVRADGTIRTAGDVELHHA